jgi:hypothetical protein
MAGLGATSPLAAASANVGVPPISRQAETLTARRRSTRYATPIHPPGHALRGSKVEVKLKWIANTSRPIAAPPEVIDLMEAPKRSLVQSGALPVPAKAKRAKVVDRRQPQLLMPVQGGGTAKEARATKPAPGVAC